MQVERARDEASEKRVVWTIIVTRAVYALNWLNIATIFAEMGADFKQGPVGLGLLTASFYAGVGLMQVPGGIVAARYGYKKVSVAGTLVASGAALLCGLVPSFGEVVALRFVVGAGMALFFGPALVILTRSLRRETSGLGVGMYNSAFAIGGFVAFFFWGILASTFGWRPSVEISGAMGLLTGVAVLVVVPRDVARAGFTLRLAGLRRIIMNRKLVLLGLGVLALSIGNGLIQSFMFYYVNQKLGLGVAESGLVSSLIVILPILSSLLVGSRFYDRMRKPRLLMVVADVVMAGALLIAAGGSVAAAVASGVVGGIVSGLGFTAGFAAARDLNDIEREYDSLAVAWVNSISLLGSFGPPIVFSFVATLAGYSLAWVVGAVLVLAFTLPLAFLEEGIRLREASL
ncbi:MAG TPA: MFS transporter [Nitrososphaerales archaeon]|nr:MFS transporter [Nitrososphaerales archaeon]